MMQTDIMYDFHTIEIDLKIKDIEQKLKSTKNSIDNSIEFFLLRYKSIGLSDEQVQNLIRNSILPKITQINSVSNLFNIKANNYIKFTSYFKIQEEQLKSLENQKIPKSIYKYILTRFNTLLVEEMINNFYEFKHSYLGSFKVIVNKSKNACINWGLSLKKKEEILKRGGIPFNSKDSKQIENYKGEEYLQYLPTYRLFFKWDFTSANTIRIPNLRNYTFKTVRGVKSSTALLSIRGNNLSQKELEIMYNTK